MKKEILNKIKKIFDMIDGLEFNDKVELINDIRYELHLKSPFKNEPVDFIRWVSSGAVQANDYNPNAVAPPEMELLKHSVEMDGYTQPIVAWENDNIYEVIDGFHRNRVGKECPEIQERINGYLPLTIIKEDREGRNNRIASTIRHNRARGKHSIDGMAEIVIELKRRNWSDKKIGKELGMDPDEVLRLSQITGLAEMFANHEFSEAWEPDATEDGSGKSIDANSNDVDFLWATLLSREDSESGWIDKTEKMSVFYDDNQQRLGQVKKSRFEKNTWFWYVYKQPMSSGKAHSLLEAKRQVEINWGI